MHPLAHSALIGGAVMTVIAASFALGRGPAHQLRDKPFNDALHEDIGTLAMMSEQIEAMKRMGQPTSHATHGTFTEIQPHTRLAITHVIDFLPGVTPYDSTVVVEFFPSGDHVRMVITLTPMHDAHWTEMATMGWTSQLRKLEKRYAG